MGESRHIKKEEHSSKETSPIIAHKGGVLKKVREERGLSLENVHEATKIPLDALRAIEEGYTVKILSEFYIKGFLKIYAAYLNLDVSEIIDNYKKETLPKHIDHPVIEDFKMTQWVSRILTRRRKRQIVIISAGMICLFLLFKVTSFLMAQKPSSEKRYETNKNQEEQVSKKDQQVKENKIFVEKKVEPKAVVSSKTMIQKSDQLTQVVIKKVVLTVRAKKNSWLRVKSDGQVVFQSTLQSGAVETWSANEKIEISGNNIGQLEFELNGKLIGPLSKSNRQAKMLIATAEGLTVTK